MATLLNIGINGKNIVYINANISSSESDLEDYLQFNNHKICNAIYEQINEAGIRTLSGYNLSNWKINRRTNRIETITFESRNQFLELTCLGFFYYGSRTISKKTLMAITKAGIVFDGKIVIDNQCKTNDPYIYAAGRGTKYARRYYADHLSHEYFNTMEVGYKLARNIKKILIDKYEDDELITLECKTTKSLVATYKWPLITICKLPGGLHYIYIRKPGKPVPLIVKRDMADYVSSNRVN